MRMQLACLVADALAIKEATGAKGTGGFKCCLKCMNIVNSRHTTGGIGEGIYRLDTSLEVDQFIPSSDDLVHGIFELLSDAPAGKRPELSKRLGWNFLPESWMGAEHLPRPLVSAVHFDWMHIYFIQGLFTREAPTCMASVASGRAGGRGGQIIPFPDAA